MYGWAKIPDSVECERHANCYEHSITTSRSLIWHKQNFPTDRTDCCDEFVAAPQYVQARGFVSGFLAVLQAEQVWSVHDTRSVDRSVTWLRTCVVQRGRVMRKCKLRSSGGSFKQQVTNVLLVTPWDVPPRACYLNWTCQDVTIWVGLNVHFMFFLGFVEK